MCVDCAPRSPEIVMVPVVEILRNVTASCDFGSVEDFGDHAEFWREVIRVKSADTGFGYLVESIMEHGLTGSAIGYDRAMGYINEGHHRLVAAILLGLDEVPTTPYGTNGHPTLGRNARISAHYNESGDAYPIEVAA